MDERTKVMIDAGHGGDVDPGAVAYGRREADDNLRLALAVGRDLEQKGVEVLYTRVNDVYHTPFEKAQMANRMDADYFVSLHRNAANKPGQGSGIMSLVYEEGNEAEELGEAINRELAKTGFQDLGIFERPDLIVLRRTKMPAVLVEAGFIDNPEDNRRFEAQFEEIAGAISDGIFNFLMAQKEKEGETDRYYMIQTGAYRMRTLAEQQLQSLKEKDYPAYLVYDGIYYKVRVGAYKNLDYAVRMEQRLRQDGYSTVLLFEQETK